MVAKQLAAARFNGGGGDAVLLDKHRLVPLGEALPTLPLGVFSGLSAVGGLHRVCPHASLMGLIHPERGDLLRDQ